MRKILIPILTIILLNATLSIFYLSIPHALSVEWLDVIARTDKTSYTYRNLVTIYGELQLMGNPVSGIAGVEVVNPNNQTLVTRAVPAGSPTLTNIIEIVSVTPCDIYGNPKYTFIRGKSAHVKVVIKSNDLLAERHVIITVVAYDNDSTPILPSVKFLETDILPNSTIEYKPEFPLYTWISTGNAKFYACVFSDWPRKGGIPYTVEKYANFLITTSGGAATLSINSTEGKLEESNGYYVKFRLPPDEISGAPFGNYTVHVRANSQGYTGGRTITFTRAHQILADVNYDHNIDIIDVVLVTSKYGSKSGDLNWTPEVDLQPSGKIDISDVVVVTSKYGQKY